MGVQAEMGNAADDVGLFMVLEHIFTAVFSLEMGLKLYVCRLDYFADHWNLLDCFVAWVSIIYAWILPAFNVRGGSNMSVIKVFRLLRLLRIIKLTNSIPTLRMVVEGLIGYDRDWDNIVSSVSFSSFNNYEYFGNVSRSMMTLLSMSLLAEWDAFRPIWEFQPMMSPLIFILIFC